MTSTTEEVVNLINELGEQESQIYCEAWNMVAAANQVGINIEFFDSLMFTYEHIYSLSITIEKIRKIMNKSGKTGGSTVSASNPEIIPVDQLNLKPKSFSDGPLDDKSRS